MYSAEEEEGREGERINRTDLGQHAGVFGSVTCTTDTLQLAQPTFPECGSNFI